MISGKPVSRVLSWTVIYLGQTLLPASSDPPTGSLRATGFDPCLVLLRVWFTRPPCLHDAGELLTRHFTLTTALSVSAVCFCCTGTVVTYAGRYPVPSPCGARTFLMPHTAPKAEESRDCLAYPKSYFFFFFFCSSASLRMYIFSRS